MRSSAGKFESWSNENRATLADTARVVVGKTSGTQGTTRSIRYWSSAAQQLVPASPGSERQRSIRPSTLSTCVTRYLSRRSLAWVAPTIEVFTLGGTRAMARPSKKSNSVDALGKSLK